MSLRVPLTLAYEAARMGPNAVHATWGQKYIWNVLKRYHPNEHLTNLLIRVDVPKGRTTENVVSALRTVVERHESLRTHLLMSVDGKLLQQLSERGSIGGEIIPLDPSADPRVAADIVQALRSRRFDPSSTDLLRFSIIVDADGVPWRLVVVLSHIVCDELARAIVQDELEALLENVAQLPPATWHPQDQAAWERSSDGFLHEQEALRHWRTTLEQFPRSMFCMPPGKPAPLRWGVGYLSSPTLERSLPALARKYRVTQASAVIAALVIATAYKTGQDFCAARLRIGNRMNEEAVLSVAHLSQDTPLFVPITDWVFSSFSRRLHQQLMTLYTIGGASPDSVHAIRSEIDSRRTTPIELTTSFNVVSKRRQSRALSYPDQPPGPALTRFVWSAADDRPFIELSAAVTTPCDLSITADTSYLDRHQVEAMLRGVEAIIANALDVEPDVRGILNQAGLATFERDVGWVRCGNTWIDSARTKSQVRALLGTDVVDLFLLPETDGPTLVAYARVQTLPDCTAIASQLRASAQNDASIGVPRRLILCDQVPEVVNRTADDWAQLRTLRNIFFG